MFALIVWLGNPTPCRHYDRNLESALWYTDFIGPNFSSLIRDPCFIQGRRVFVLVSCLDLASGHILCPGWDLKTLPPSSWGPRLLSLWTRCVSWIFSTLALRFLVGYMGSFPSLFWNGLWHWNFRSYICVDFYVLDVQRRNTSLGLRYGIRSRLLCILIYSCVQQSAYHV